MYKFTELLPLIISILLFYFSIYIQLKKDLNDLNSPNYLEYKIRNTANLLNLSKIITLFLIFFVILSYNWSSVSCLLYYGENTNYNIITFEIIKYVFKPFIYYLENIDDSNFSVFYLFGSYISVIILSLYYTNLSKKFTKSIYKIIAILLLFYILIWINYYLSNYLSYYFNKLICLQVP